MLVEESCESVQYTDASGAFAVDWRRVTAHEVGKPGQGTLDVPVGPEQIGLSREACDLGKSQVLLVTQPEQQALIGRQPGQCIVQLLSHLQVGCKFVRTGS